MGFAESGIQGALAPALNDYMQANFSWWQDTISGGSGSNNLAGGRGSDMFIFEQSDGSQNIVYGWILGSGDLQRLQLFGRHGRDQQYVPAGRDVLFSDQGCRSSSWRPTSRP